MSASRMVQVLVRMPSDLHAALIADATANDRTLAATVRRAVREHLALEGRPVPNTARSESLQPTPTGTQ